MYIENISIRDVRAEFGDAVFTFIHTAGPFVPGDAAALALYHSHFYYECHVLLEGEYTYLIRKDKIAVGAGTMVIIPPYAEHVRFQGAGSAKEIVLGLLLDRKEHETGTYEYFFRTLHEMSGKPLPLPEDLFSALRQFHDRFGSANMRDLCIQQAAAYEIIVKLFDSFDRFGDPSFPPAAVENSESVDVTLDMMINEFGFSLKDIAAMLGYSARHTARLIHGKYGKSLVEIRQWDMLTAAKKLMAEDPLLSMKEIAAQSFFPSVEAMSRTFLKYENLSASDYKKKIEAERTKNE